MNLHINFLNRLLRQFLTAYSLIPLFVDIAEEFLKEFTLAYNTEYGIEYTKNLLKEIDAESFAEEKPVYLLLHRSVSCWSLCNKYAKLTQQYLLISVKELLRKFAISGNSLPP